MHLELSNISHRYPNGHRALSGVDLLLGQGPFALLGPNGAGKTTLMNIMAGLVRPTTGSVAISENGQAELSPERDLERYRRSIGYLPQRFGFPPHATVEWVLEHLGRLRGMTARKVLDSRIEGVLAELNLSGRKKCRVARLSGGMRQRLGIAQAILHEPGILILDEPTVGLDPEERERFLLFLTAYSKKAIVVLSTHLIEDVEAVCRSLAFLSRGELIQVGTRQELLGPLVDKIYRSNGIAGSGELLYETLDDGLAVKRYFIDDGAVPVEGMKTDEPTIRDAYALAGLGDRK